MRKMLHSVAIWLAEEGAHDVRQEVNRIEFSGASRGASGLLKTITSGEVELSQFSNTVVAEYRIFFKKSSVLFSTAIAIAVTAVEFYRRGTDGNWLFPAVIWVWLVGGSYVAPAFKFPRGVRQAILAAGEREEPEEQESEEAQVEPEFNPEETEEQSRDR